MTDISPKDLWAQITAMPRPSQVVDFPRNGTNGKPLGEVRLRVLTQEEQMLCAAEAERYTKKAIKDLPKGEEAQLGYQSVYQNAAAVEVLFHAARQVDDHEKSFFPSRQHLREYLTADEVGVLMVQYYTVQSKLGPIVSTMTETEVDAWIFRLGEGGSAYPLDFLSWDMLKTLAFSTACLLHKSRTGSISAGTPPENTETSESSDQLSLDLPPKS